MTILKRNLRSYLALLVPSVLGFAIGWLMLAPDRLYHCWDDAPPLAISWFPPFIHPQANTGTLRDYFIWPSWAAYLTWFAFVAGAVLLPACVVWFHQRRPNAA
jgi:hypothetical protein